ncbi:putative ribonuclease H-like domain-containing protein, partial [Tanacetum coccineum]
MTHPGPKRNKVPKAALMRSGLVSLTTARPFNIAQPRTTVNSERLMTNRVNTVSGKNVNTARPKAVVNVARPKAVLNAVKGNQINVVKASACWEKGVIDSGCSRHMTGNMSYLTDFEEIDGGYVAFGGNPKGGKITGRAVLLVKRESNIELLVTEEPGKEGGDSSKEDECNDQEKYDNVNSTNNVNAASTNEVNVVGRKSSIELPDDPNIPELEDIVYSDDDEDVGTEADMNNLDAFMLVWTLVDLPNSKRAIGTKWVYKNKKNERGIVIKNEARLVTQGYTQEEGIDYDGVFAPIARIEAIRLFLAYALFKDFVVYQIDFKSAFLYGNIEEEVYVYQPTEFVDPDFLDRVYKVEKALYGLHQAPRAWYETLSTYLLDNGFQRGKIDKTFFIRRHKGDILLVQVYVDDIIFGFTKKSLCTKFEKMMHKKFQMSSMGELIFFLGL